MHADRESNESPDESRFATSTSPAGGLPVAPSLAPTLAAARIPIAAKLIDGRTLYVCALAVLVALAAGVIAQLLTRLIGLVTNLAFFGRLTTSSASPADNRLGLAVVLVPTIGGLLVGLLARYRSKAIRGHGIPEAMEQILTNQSRIPARMTLLKPLSAAIAIGTGGPFGAEGPIIATGGALGSLVGQVLSTTADERKTLLAAGAAAGMAATFGSPVAAVLLAVELLLFEFSPRSLIPVALAAAAATGVRTAFVGAAPAFPMPDIVEPHGAALAAYVALGVVVGVASVGVTRAVYAVEDGFEKLPIHWMWWPALGALAVGIVGYVDPRTLGVGYDNITSMLSGSLATRAVVVLCALKFVSWAIALGSGTSGGTLAPLFTIGGGLGAALGAALAALLPSLGVDPRIAALVGMAAMFAGASRAMLASVVFAFEITRQPLGLLPLLGGCTAAHLTSCLLMRHSIMSEKIARRGVRVLGEYLVDFLAGVSVRDACTRPVVSLAAGDTLAQVRTFVSSGLGGARHQGFPVLDEEGLVVGVVTRRDLTDPSHADDVRVGQIVRRPPAIVFDDCSLREAADHMVREGIGRLPVVTRAHPRKVVGIISRSDLLSAHSTRLDLRHRSERGLQIPGLARKERHA